MRRLSTLLGGLFTCLFITAQNNDRLLDWPMNPAAVSIKINADMFTATTSIEMEFCNTNEKEAEGVYRFGLAPGQVITRFQLELNGKYRDGSIEEQWKARNAYNTIVGKRVDPALLAMEGYNSYRLNIYPIPAKGCRKVTVTIQQLLKTAGGKLQYELPLNIYDSVRRFSLISKVVGCNMGPVIADGLLANRQFTVVDGVHTLEWKAENILLKKPLLFSMAYTLESPSFCMRRGNGKDIFALRFIPRYSRLQAFSPDKLTVYWDVSASGRERNTDKEISFLKEYISKHAITKLHIVTFNQQVQDTATFYLNGGLNRWKGYLEALKYEGATSYGCLDFSGAEGDAIFLFSDGKNSFGKDMPAPGKTHTWCISSAKIDDSVRLDKIAIPTGGRYIDLVVMNIADAVEVAGRTENRLIKVKAGDTEISLAENNADTKKDTMFLFGNLPAGIRSITLEYGNNGKSKEEEVLPVQQCQLCDESAIDRIEMLNKFDLYTRGYLPWYDILNFGKTEKIVTSSTSYIVLERIEDYIRFGIMPPPELQPECDMNIFVKADAQRQQQYKQGTELDVLRSVAAMYNNRIGKADKYAPSIIIRENDIETATAGIKNKTITNPVNTGVVAIDDSRTNITEGFLQTAGDNTTTLNEVVVTAMGQRTQARSLGYTVSVVNSKDLTAASPVNLQNGLTGKVSGLNIQTVNNGVFGDTRITLRGIRSLTGTNQPMLVLDGVPIALGYLSSINPNDINDVTVLKSAAATAIYGPDGVNGALIISTKKGSRNNNFTWQSYRLKDRADVDYLQDLKHTPEKNLVARYEELRQEYKWDASFYLDAAQIFSEAGRKKEAVNILLTAVDVSNGSREITEAAGYILETWKEFDEAIYVYKNLLADNPLELNCYRNMALAYYQKGDYNNAVQTYYKGITLGMGDSERYYSEYKSMMLQEMNAVIAAHRNAVNTDGIKPELIRPLNYDLRITLDCNTRNMGRNITVTEPGGNKCTYNKPKRADGELSGGYYNGVEEYQLQHAKTGKYKISLRYYGNNVVGVPVVIRVLTFRQTQKGPELELENVMMDNQYGDVEIAEVKW